MIGILLGGLASPDNAATLAQTSAAPEVGCATYSARELKKFPAANGHWLITDGKGFKQQAFNENDADLILSITTFYSKRCKVKLSGRRSYDYWEDSGPVSGTPPPHACDNYAPSSLALSARGVMTNLSAGNQTLGFFEDLKDAQKILAIAKTHSQVCFVGTEVSPSEPDRPLFIVNYWR